MGAGIAGQDKTNQGYPPARPLHSNTPCHRGYHIRGR